MSRRQPVHEILEEHRLLRQAIHRLEIDLDRLLDRPARPMETWELPGLVRGLRDGLRAHFELEERRGPLAQTSDAGDGRIANEMRALVAEHRAFERALERLEAELSCGFVPGGTVQRCFDGELRTLLSDLTRHEAREGILFAQLVTDHAGPRDAPSDER